MYHACNKERTKFLKLVSDPVGIKKSKTSVALNRPGLFYILSSSSYIDLCLDKIVGHSIISVLRQTCRPYFLVIF